MLKWLWGSPVDTEIGSTKIPSVDHDIPITDIKFWMQHAPTHNPGTEIGITTPSFQDYVMETSRGPVSARSMLTEYEIALLYAMARYHYKGVGAIVDLGPLIGIGTYALCRGMKANPVQSDVKRVYSYDLFLMEYMSHFLPATDAGGTRSVFNRFLELNRDHLDNLTIVPGDFLKMSWTGEPIEIIFIDLAKSWELNRHVLTNFFPHLIPGHSIVLQQDYVHAGEPWVALAMEVLDEYFEKLYFVYGATAAYCLIKPIPPEVLNQDFRAIPLEQVNMLFERARSRVTPAIAEVLKCCQAVIVLEKGDIDGASKLIDTIDPKVRDGLHESQEFGPAIKASLNAVKKILTRARTHAP